MLIVSKNALPAKDLKELIAWLKANQDKATIGTAGVGSGAHFSGVYFQSLIGTKIQLRALSRHRARRCRTSSPARSTSLSIRRRTRCRRSQAGTIRAYGVTDTKRLAAAPDIPTVGRGRPAGLHMSRSGTAFWVPKGTPKDVIAKLNAAVVEALADPAVRKRLGDVGVEFRRASSRRRKRCARCRRPRPTNGGRSSRRRASSRSNGVGSVT